MLIVIIVHAMTYCKCSLSRYVLKVTVSRGYAGSIVEYQDFVVLSLSLSLSEFVNIIVQHALTTIT